MGMTILLVDDEESVLRPLSLLLKSEGFQVTTAKDGCEAAEIITSHKEKGIPFDLVLTDLCMPKRNGVELICWVQKFHGETKTILYSGCDKEGVLDQVKGEVSISFLRKPFTIEKLVAKIQAVLKLN